MIHAKAPDVRVGVDGAAGANVTTFLSEGLLGLRALRRARAGDERQGRDGDDGTRHDRGDVDGVTATRSRYVVECSARGRRELVVTDARFLAKARP